MSAVAPDSTKPASAVSPYTAARNRKSVLQIRLASLAAGRITRSAKMRMVDGIDGIIPARNGTQQQQLQHPVKVVNEHVFDNVHGEREEQARGNMRGMRTKIRRVLSQCKGNPKLTMLLRGPRDS